MKNSFLFVLTYILCLINTSCEKIVYENDNPFFGLNTRVLMHRGSGNNDTIRENTFEAAQYGLSLLDGIELDIQLSKNGTIWLDHDNEVIDCNGIVVGCFQELTDEQIRDASICNGENRYNKLEPVFQLMESQYPRSFISLDVKGQYCDILNTPETMRIFADQIQDLVNRYNMRNRVLVESSSINFLDEISGKEGVGQFYINLEDIDKGIANAKATDARGISQKFEAEEYDNSTVEFIRNNGLGTLIWIVNDSTDIRAVWETAPDFIQTDNPYFLNIVE